MVEEIIECTCIFCECFLKKYSTGKLCIELMVWCDRVYASDYKLLVTFFMTVPNWGVPLNVTWFTSEE